jgi:hypothetical protein
MLFRSYRRVAHLVRVYLPAYGHSAFYTIPGLLCRLWLKGMPREGHHAEIHAWIFVLLFLLSMFHTTL